MNSRADIALRASAFLFIALALWFILPAVLQPLGLLVYSTFTTLLAGLAANLACAHWFEDGKSSDFGLAWNKSTARHLGRGFLLGAGAVALLAVTAVATGAAEFAHTETASPALSLPLFLFLGALGEELLFHGYLFQYLTRITNPIAIIAGVGALFGLAHLLSNDATPIGVLNTALWGGVLGFAMWRSGSLWLPAGIHFGWNLGLALLGEPLSGIKMGVTEFGLVWHAGELWSGGSYGPEAGLPTTGLAGVLYWVLRRRVTKRPLG
jgi:membrane protease YdiL (CAAX protease family)